MDQVITAVADGTVEHLPEGTYDTGRRRCAPIAYNFATLSPEYNVTQAYRIYVIPKGRKLPMEGTGPDVMYYRKDGCGVVQMWSKL